VLDQEAAHMKRRVLAGRDADRHHRRSVLPELIERAADLLGRQRQVSWHVE